jgi:Tfp pilus assembly protein PilF
MRGLVDLTASTSKLICLGFITVVLMGCTAQPVLSGVGVTDISERRAEKSLLAGIRAYEEGTYVSAEQLLTKALEYGLSSGRDRAVARKHLAFIYCTTNRISACESAFRAARQDDPSFALTKSEANHPQWGQIYLRTR